MNYKKLLVLIAVLLLASTAIVACGAPSPENTNNSRTEEEGSAVTLLPDYYLGYGQQYAAVFLNDPLTGKRCLIVYNNGGGASVNGAAPSTFCYDQ